MRKKLSEITITLSKASVDLKKALKEAHSMIQDTFNIVTNDVRKQFEFTPKIEGFTSYTVAFSECDNVEDACIAVWKSIQAEKLRKNQSPCNQAK